MGRRADPIDKQSREILEGIDGQDDPRMAWGAVRRRIISLQEAGHEVPQALVSAERALMCELMATSQGR